MSNNEHFNSSMLAIREKYLEAGGKEPFELRELAAWAINKKLYDVPFDDKISRFCRDMRRVLREETHVAPDGNAIRTFQCVRASVPSPSGNDEQRFLWADIRKANPNFVLAAYSARHKSTRCDVRALQSDCDTYNHCYKPADFPPIEFDWDFSAPQADEGLGETG